MRVSTMSSSLTRAGRRRVGAAGLAALCSCLAVASSADAYVVRETGSGLPVHWPQDSISLEVDPSVIDGVPGAMAAVTAAALAWSGSGAGPELHVSLAGAASRPAIDGRNVVYLMSGAESGAGEALAITLVSYDDTTGEIVDADIVLNSSYAFAVLPPGSSPSPAARPVANDPLPGLSAASAEPGPGAWLGRGGDDDGTGTFDVVHVLVHESGHLLGLRDSLEPSNEVMYLYSSPGDATRRAPTADDVAGASYLYAGVPASTPRGCTPSTIAPRGGERSAASTLVACCCMVVLALWRRREGVRLS